MGKGDAHIVSVLMVSLSAPSGGSRSTNEGFGEDGWRGFGGRSGAPRVRGGRWGSRSICGVVGVVVDGEEGRG